MQINVSNIQIPYEELLMRIGYGKTSPAPDKNTQTLISETLQTAKRLIKPKAAVVFSNIQINGNVIDFESGFRIESGSVARVLNNCFKAYGIAITIGAALEKKRNDLIAKKETLQAFLLDCAGSVAAEEVIKSANFQIKKFEESNNNITSKRFSPGYADWKLESQKKFLEWIGASAIGISLSNACQMFPEKSVSAIIGAAAGISAK
ncbi:MAG: hypothetical protein LBL00_03275 [Endomicrobium sp.]|jgi:hypothetical protein|nr:hypothetical protein [Endomicrobium sp.]